MKRVRHLTCALITLAVLGVSGPTATAHNGGSVPPADDKYPYNWIGSHTVGGSADWGGITVTFNVTITSCSGRGDNCRRGPTGFEPK